MPSSHLPLCYANLSWLAKKFLSMLPPILGNFISQSPGLLDAAQHGLLQGISMPPPAACRHPSSGQVGQVGMGVSRNASVSARGHQLKSLSCECPSRNMAGFTQHCHSIFKSTGFARGGLGLEHEVFSYGFPFLDRLLQINGSKNFTPCQPGDQTWLKKDIYLIFCVLTCISVWPPGL